MPFEERLLGHCSIEENAYETLGLGRDRSKVLEKLHAKSSKELEYLCCRALNYGIHKNIHGHFPHAGLLTTRPTYLDGEEDLAFHSCLVAMVLEFLPDDIVRPRSPKWKWTLVVVNAVYLKLYGEIWRAPEPPAQIVPVEQVAAQSHEEQNGVGLVTPGRVGSTRDGDQVENVSNSPEKLALFQSAEFDEYIQTPEGKAFVQRFQKK